jgi:hypothetical protein
MANHVIARATSGFYLAIDNLERNRCAAQSETYILNLESMFTFLVQTLFALQGSTKPRTKVGVAEKEASFVGQ